MTDTPAPRPARRKGLALGVGGAVLAVAAVGGGVWGYKVFYGQGDQPAQALPAKGLLGYMAIDMSPNGEQLLAARSTLKKFPGIADEIKLGGKDDIRKELFDKLKGDGDGCGDLDDYDKDVKPWLGDRLAVAALDEGEGKEPAEVVVLQTKDHAKAKAAESAILSCMGQDLDPSEERLSAAFSGDWLVVAQGDGKAESVVKAAAKGSLADDDSYATWTDAAGDPGIITAYGSKLGYQRMIDFMTADSSMKIPDAVADEAKKFAGAGLVGRFRDGGLEIELASKAGGKVATSGDIVSSLPKSTVAAFGVGLPDGWRDTVEKFYGPVLEDEAGVSLKQAEEMLTQQTGLTFDDVETLLGKGLTVSVDSGLSGDAFEQMDPTALPVGIKIKGDPDKIEKVVEKVRATFGAQGMPSGFIVSKESGDYEILSVNPKYADKLASERGLGDTETFKKLVPNASDSVSSFFLDFDAQNWLDDLFKDLDAPKDVRDNVAPLSGIGLSSWKDGDKAHVLIKVATD
ncbi:DUF3352 domain-containing protein [Nocardioides jiangxiensis]|uniref:DUF3352 domain-containing protein n=1 Tax=Nocardioides jiangxiensis TaxID=3064524 RepID=A0ABT9B3E8_9ACTN|nr:DUF3352 domain-containing protein [Nocardioides sp. WY-20]MDO7869361.1 DUF3352 domain-containing protein [Nocardioides sp. WY-20]